MALRIISANEPMKVDQLVVTIYGQPGVGKTSLGFTAESPLLLDFDHGAYRAMGRKDTVDVSAWSDVTHIEASDLDGYKTIVVDTAGRALDALAADIIRREPKLGRGGALTQQGWGRLKSEFTSWLTLLRSFGLDVVLIAHGTEKMDGDETIVRLDVAGGSKDEIYKSADMMGRLFIRGGRRMISFDPTDTAYGKNPASFSALLPCAPIQSRLLSQSQAGGSWIPTETNPCGCSQYPPFLPATRDLPAAAPHNQNNLLSDESQACSS